MGTPVATKNPMARRYALAVLTIGENGAANLGTIRIGLSATGLRSANQRLCGGRGPRIARKEACSVPERVKMPTWNGGAGVSMMVAGPRLARPLQATDAMTSSANNNNPPAHRVAAGSGGLAPRLADDDRKRKSGSSGEPGGPSTAVITKTKPQTKRPSMYRVLILNDDYTPMEFVVHVLERFFGKDHEAATRIMLHVHHHGLGECGVYTYEVAETKVTQVMDFARKHQHPLQCVMEKK